MEKETDTMKFLEIPVKWLILRNGKTKHLFFMTLKIP